MKRIHVKYDEVSAETTNCRNYISSNIISRVHTEYRKIQSDLRQVDGATNAALQEVMEINQQKTVACATAVQRLLNFMANSSNQIQISEAYIARSFQATRR